MVIDGETGLLATDDQWFDKLEAFSFISRIKAKLSRISIPRKSLKIVP